ncbi:hypothetical protein A2752_04510 [Candidatus Uhrbacteria bacterium RIFCSPHIGHO2_01_FULL_46_23]|nr:MAG: hypothetical protein A2752_04510 [Candidatus Uhrbacteria bacterium RIFCSPHIGHO2_01_FULL_46_23]
MILVKQVVSWQPSFYWRWLYRRFLADRWQYRIFPQQRWLLAQIKKLRPRSILEAGCGFGRNLNFLIEQRIRSEILTGADISAKLLAQSGLPKAVKLVRADVLNLPFNNRSFDLVFTHGLLMHVNPRNLNRAMAELIRITKKYLIIIEEVRPWPQPLNYFTWAHDYDKIIKSLPLKVMIKKKGKYSLVWYLLKKLNTATGASLTRTSF